MILIEITKNFKICFINDYFSKLKLSRLQFHFNQNIANYIHGYIPKLVN